MQGLPINQVDPAKPICPHCGQNVEVIKGRIKPHGMKYNTLGPERMIRTEHGLFGRRSYQIATAYCRKSNRPYPGMEAELENEKEEGQKFDGRMICAEDAIINFLLTRPNEGFKAGDIAYACDIRQPGTGRLNGALVDRTLKDCTPPDGYKLRHVRVSQSTYVWAMVTI